MKYYNLEPNETVLYKCEAEDVEVVLTNINLVLIKKEKKLFCNDEITVDVHSIEDVKIYNGVPQIKQSNCDVEIFLSTTETTVTFCSKGDARKFVSAALELLTGKTAYARGAAKVKSTIAFVDDTLGIDTVGTVKNVLGKSVPKGVLDIFVKKPNADKKVAALNQANDGENGDDSVEKLKKLKDLLDSGIITQEEFDEKKQEILSEM